MLLRIPNAHVSCFVSYMTFGLRLTGDSSQSNVHQYRRFPLSHSVFISRALARFAISTMISMTAMPEKMHTYESNPDQYPNPICCQPSHYSFPLSHHALLSQSQKGSTTLRLGFFPNSNAASV